MNTDWFRDWFNTQEYLNVYKHRNESDAEEHIELILSKVNLPKSSSVLDMACGAGRHSIILAKKGFDVTAVDLSENLLAYAKNLAAKEDLSIDFIKSDLRQFETEKRFDLIVNLFTSFGYFDDDSDNFLVLKKAYSYLKKDGYFVLDFINKFYLEKNIIPYSINTFGGKEIIQQRRIVNNRVNKEIKIKSNGHTQLFHESVRLYSPDELTSELKKNGFDIQFIFGDFEGCNFDKQNSERIIIFCRK